MFENKLIALDYHSPNDFEYLDENIFRNFISWLENQKIRLYTIDDRQGLDKVDSSDWPQAYEKYLNDLDLRNLNISIEREIQIEKLLSHAIRLDYSDNPDSFNLKSQSEDSKNQDSSIDQYDILDKIDYSSDDFVNGLNKLQRLFGMQSKESDSTTNLQALSLLIEQRLGADFSKINSLQISGNKEVSPIQLALKDIDLGFDTNDKAVNDAAKILRLLHIKQLRDLQTQINETIVSVQNITANPKTDSSLGKVGR